MVTPIVPITTTPAPENTPVLQTILTVMVWTAPPQRGMELLHPIAGLPGGAANVDPRPTDQRRATGSTMSR
jgi:hypothetical protein